jgi:hypothetical protein
MRTRWVLAFLGAFGTVEACGGSSIERHEGSGASAGDDDGGTSSAGSGSGATNSSGTNAGGTSGTSSSGSGGTSSGGTSSGGTSPEPTCAEDAQCPYPKSLCLTCENGAIACATPTCFAGKCSGAPAECPECRTDADCPALPIECARCGDGRTSCPSFECHGGKCLTRFDCTEPCAGRACGELCYPCTGSDCPSTELFTCDLDGVCSDGNPACLGHCETASDCPIPPPDCIECLDSSSCAQMACINGVCAMICDQRQRCDTVSDCEPTLECAVCPNESCGQRACIDGGCQRLCPESAQKSP